jgi:glycosyltransferase involved in cell wall biosynthesis
MKIFYIANVRLPTERAHGLQIMKMCEAFAANGADVELVAPERKNTEIKDDPFSYYSVKSIFSIRKIKSADFLGRTLSWGHLFFWLDLFSFLYGLRRLNLPKDSVVYSRDAILLLPFSGREYKRVLELHSLTRVNYFWRKLAKRTDKVIVLTKILKDEVVKMGFSSEKILVAPDGVDLEEFGKIQSQDEARRELGLPLGEKIVLYTGHLYSWKGASTVAEAAKSFDSKTLFVFVGGVDLELAKFKKDYGQSANIKIIPFQKHSLMPKYLAAADILTIPNSAKSKISTSYTSPLKLFEYMASGRPIVASDLPSLREILDDSLCLFAEADNPESFAKQIKKLIEDKPLGNRLATKSLAVVKNYSWRSRAEKILKFIKND